MRYGGLSAPSSLTTALLQVILLLVIFAVPNNKPNHAVIAQRLMAPGIADIEGSPHGHDVIPVKSALKYLSSRGYPDFTDFYSGMKAVDHAYLHIGSTQERGANRVVFGEACNLVLDTLSKEEAAKKVMVIDSTSPLICALLAKD